MEKNRIKDAAGSAPRTLREDVAGRAGPVPTVAAKRTAADTAFAPITAILAHCERKTGVMMRSVREIA